MNFQGGVAYQLLPGILYLIRKSYLKKCPMQRLT